MPKVFISTVPFAENDDSPIRMLDAAAIEYVINPLGRKLKEPELAEMIVDYDALIAGTETISDGVLAKGNRLKIISRVGIGLDSVDLHAARRRGIKVSYTPDAPAKAVTELTIGLMINLLRHVHISNAHLHTGKWKRLFGRRLGEIAVGLIGAGRIGTGVLSRLQAFGCRRLLVNDIRPNPALETAFRFEWASKETIFRDADLISLHVPLTSQTRNMITRRELESMRPDALLVNTARGGLVNETDLYDVMKNGHLGGAALDVFEQEPYDGPLREVERCLLTAHMGSMSIDCRTRMEVEATEEAVRFLTGQTLRSEVPDVEYENQ